MTEKDDLLTWVQHDCVRDQRYLGELLARIHGDGGHYQSSYGTGKAVKVADDIVVNMAEELDSAQHEIERLRKIIAGGQQ
jgi:hypothetical protein